MTWFRKLKHKFQAKPNEYEGKKFPSILEKDCYIILNELKKKGYIIFFTRQFTFDLPGNSVHKVDYCIFTPNDVIFVEAKGRDLSYGRLKRKQVEDIYNVKIYVVKKASQIYEVVQT